MGKYRPQEDRRARVCASYDGYSTSGFLHSESSFREGRHGSPGSRVAESTAHGAHASTHTAPVPVPRESRPLRGTCPFTHRRAACRALKSHGCSRRALLLRTQCSTAGRSSASLLRTRAARNKSTGENDTSLRERKVTCQGVRKRPHSSHIPDSGRAACNTRPPPPRYGGAPPGRPGGRRAVAAGPPACSLSARSPLGKTRCGGA